MILSTFGKATSRLATLGEKVSPSHPALKTIQMPERIRHEHQTPMFSNGFSVAHAILVQAQMRFTVLIKSFHLPDIMPPKVEAFTRCTSHPKNGYATGSLWRCPSWWSCSS